MAGTQLFGYLLIALSAVMLAQHWFQWRDLRARALRLAPRDRAYYRSQLQRRSAASAMIGVVGAAMTLVDRVPRNPVSLSAYLFALVWGGAVILVLALADWRATRLRREGEQLDLLARELRKAQPSNGRSRAKAREIDSQAAR